MLIKLVGSPDRGGTDVKLIDQYPVYQLGATMQALKDQLDEKSAPIDQLVAIFTASQQLSALLDGNPVEISYCRDSVAHLISILDGAEREFRDKETGHVKSDIKSLHRWWAQRITTAIEVFEHQLSAELKKTATYVVPERGIFNTERLVDDADRHIHVSVRGEVPEFALDEFKGAGRCLAFGLFSASGFHAARAVESVLKAYYASFIAPNDDLTMGLMASNLADLHKKKPVPSRLPNESTLRHVKDVTTFDRNPLVHKNVNLEEIDALTLLNSAHGAIVAMAKELKALNEPMRGFEPIKTEPETTADLPLEVPPAPSPKHKKSTG